MLASGDNGEELWRLLSFPNYAFGGWITARSCFRERRPNLLQVSNVDKIKNDDLQKKNKNEE